VHKVGNKIELTVLLVKKCGLGGWHSGFGRRVIVHYILHLCRADEVAWSTVTHLYSDPMVTTCVIW